MGNFSLQKRKGSYGLGLIATSLSGTFPLVPALIWLMLKQAVLSAHRSQAYSGNFSVSEATMRQLQVLIRNSSCFIFSVSCHSDGPPLPCESSLPLG